MANDDLSEKFTNTLANCITKCYTFTVRKLINDRPTEWDEEKEKINITKHGLDFTTAAKVFDDITRLEYYDKLHSIDEDRYIVIGLVHKVLFVVYTEREDCTRIISARKATKAERSVYYGNSSQNDL